MDRGALNETVWVVFYVPGRGSRWSPEVPCSGYCLGVTTLPLYREISATLLVKRVCDSQ